MIKQYSIISKKDTTTTQMETLNDTEINSLLEKRAKELNLTVSKCVKCSNPCTKCKLNFLQKEHQLNIKKKPVMSSLDYHKNKRKIQKFWNY